MFLRQAEDTGAKAVVNVASLADLDAAMPDLGNGLAVRCKLAELEPAFLDSPNELDPGNRGRRIVE